MGLVPTRYYYHKILSLARLPIPTLPQVFNSLPLLFSPTTNIIIAPAFRFVNSYFKINQKIFSPFIPLLSFWIPRSPVSLP